MKKVLSMFLVCGIVILLAGCVQTSANGKIPHYSIVDSEFNLADGSIRIRYPQIAGLSDSVKQTMINQKIVDLTVKMLEATLPTQLSNLYAVSYQSQTPLHDSKLLEYVGIQYDYKITYQSNRILSVVYPGVLGKSGERTDNAIYSETFDMETAQELKLTDFAEIDTDFVNTLYQADDITTFDKSQKLERYIIEDVNSAEEIIRDFTAEGKNGSNAFYLTSESLVVSVPVYDAAGDYALITLPGNYVDRYCKQ